MSLTAFALSVFVSPGCRTTDPNYVEIQKHWSSGNTQAASIELLANATKENIEKSNEPLLWELNAGAVTNASGDFGMSENWLVAAQARMKKGAFKEADEKTLLERSMAALGKYEPTMQEGIMISLLRFYNAMGTGTHLKGLKHEVSKLNEVQKEMISQKLKTEVARMKERNNPIAIPMGDKTITINPWEELNENKDAVISVYKDDVIKINLTEGELRAVYTSPFAYWLSSIITAHTAKSQSDFHRASNILKSAVAIAPDNELLRKTMSKFAMAKNDVDLEQANRNVFGSGTPSMTYVIYEGGQAPTIGAKAVEIQIPKAVNIAVVGALTAAGALIADSEAGKYIAGGYCATAAAAIPGKATAYLPVLESRGDTPELTVNGENLTPLIDFNLLMEKRLELEANENITSQIIKAAGVVALRGGAIGTSAIGMVKACENGNAITANIAAEAFKGAVVESAKPIELSQPDKRVWDFLPRTISVAELMTPENGKITLSGEDIEVPVEGVNIVRVRKVSDADRGRVQIFSLKNDGTVSLVAATQISGMSMTKKKTSGQEAKFVIKNGKKVGIATPVEPESASAKSSTKKDLQ